MYKMFFQCDPHTELSLRPLTVCYRLYIIFTEEVKSQVVIIAVVVVAATRTTTTTTSSWSIYR